MIYDFTVFGLRPNTLGTVMPKLADAIAANSRRAKLVGCFTCDFGVLNRITVLTEYPDVSVLAEDRAATMANCSHRSRRRDCTRSISVAGSAAAQAAILAGADGRRHRVRPQLGAEVAHHAASVPEHRPRHDVLIGKLRGRFAPAPVLPLARLLARAPVWVLIPLIAVLAAASTWFGLYLLTVGWAP